MDNVILWPEGRKQTRNICVTSVLIAFIIGLSVGVIIPLIYFKNNTIKPQNKTVEHLISSVFINNSHKDLFPSVTFIERSGVIEDGIYWGRNIEENLPKGYGNVDNSNWSTYIDKAIGIHLEIGCGRMQNRLVTFQDGTKGCVRYRQNLDQIQGELFSFYLAQLLQLPNLAPSAVSLVDLKSPNWQNLHFEINSAQWTANRPIVITKYIDNLDNARIPKSFRPPEVQLNHKELAKGNVTVKEYAELAQWSDLVVFDYLTANLDRVVNNLYNKQWNINIMEAPAHNLARRQDDLLVFLDNESGLLHGYRLLQKYEPYHALLLDNLCIFRRRTVNAIERLRRDKNIGVLLSDMFERGTGGNVRDFLPPLPAKSVKILNERLDRVYNQISRCKREAKRNM